MTSGHAEIPISLAKETLIITGITTQIPWRRLLTLWSNLDDHRNDCLFNSVVFILYMDGPGDSELKLQYYCYYRPFFKETLQHLCQYSEKIQLFTKMHNGDD